MGFKITQYDEESKMNSQCVNNQVFVPVTDEMIYEHPEQIEGPLVPYAAGMECHEWISIEINPEEPIAARRNSVQKPRLAYSAA